MIEINLIAKKKINVPTFMGVSLTDIPWIKIVFGYLLYANAPFYFSQYLSGERDKISRKIDGLIRKNKVLQEESRENQNIEKLMSDFKNQLKSLEEREKYVVKIIKARTNPHLLLSKVARSAPEELWFDKVLINEKKEISVSGGSFDYKSIGNFIENANDSPFFENGLKLKSSKTVQEVHGGVEIRVESFQIEGKIALFDPFGR